MSSGVLGGGGGSKYKNHHYAKNTQISAYLNPVEGHRGAMEKRGVVPRDHLRENKQALKELQSAIRQKKEQGSEPPPPMWKMEKFSRVPSKVALAIHKKPSSPAGGGGGGPESNEEEQLTTVRDFLRKGTLTKRVSEKAIEALKHRPPHPEDHHHPPQPSARGRSSSNNDNHSVPPSPSCYTSPRGSIGYSTEGLTPRKPAVPRATDLARLAPKSNKNHVVENRRTAVQTHPPTKSDEQGPYRHKSFGQIPHYLQERKDEWAAEEEKRRAALPDPNCPPGMRLLTDDERQETLHALAESEAEIRRQLVRIPLQVDTPSMIRRREELERRLGEIAKDKLLFAKPKVFVKADDY